MEQLTKEQAIKLHDSKEWENWNDEQIVRLQLFQKLLCIPFSRFHQAMESVLDRPVYTHEFTFSKQLKEEYLGIKKQPTIREIIKLIPKNKKIVIDI